MMLQLMKRKKAKKVWEETSKTFVFDFSKKKSRNMLLVMECIKAKRIRTVPDPKSICFRLSGRF